MATHDPVNAPLDFDAAADVRLLPIDGPVRTLVESVAATSPAIIPQQHPVWLDILGECGERMLSAALFRGDRLAGWMTAAVRSAPFGTAASSLPFLVYGGPAVPNRDATVAAALVRWFVAAAEEAGAGAASTGLSPFAAPAEVEAVLAALGADEAAFRFENFAQVQPLDPHPLAQLSKARRDKLASPIRRAEREGVEAWPSDDPRQFEEWLAIYRQRYEEIGARPLPEDFHRSAFERGRAAGIVEFWTATQRGRLLGGSLFLTGCSVVDYFSSAYLTDPQTRLLSPNNLLLGRAFESFAERGKSWFNWQSSPGREGVYRFKAGWGAEERPHPYVGRILPGEAGERLLAATPAEILSGFPARFVLPFPRLAGGG